jgi:cyclopropane-fatty-acyl-phospholipid synthase
MPALAEVQRGPMSERFARMWEFQLGAAKLGFLHGANMVFQLLVSERCDDVPVLRDYMFDDARALRANGY